MSMSPEERIADWEYRVDQQARRTQELGERIERTTSSAESPDGEVRATVDSTGGLIDLQLRRGAGDMPLTRLAALIVSTSKRAQARMADEIGVLVSDLYGSESGTAQFVRTAYAQRFPDPDSRGDESR